MISRRRFFALFGAAAAGLAETYLPPIGGWPRNALAQIKIPRSELEYYAEALTSGRYEYDIYTEMMTLYQLDPSHHSGKFHSAWTNREYDWADVAGNGSQRAKIDDELDFIGVA